MIHTFMFVNTLQISFTRHLNSSFIVKVFVSILAPNVPFEDDDDDVIVGVGVVGDDETFCLTDVLALSEFKAAAAAASLLVGKIKPCENSNNNNNNNNNKKQ